MTVKKMRYYKYLEVLIILNEPKKLRHNSVIIL